MKYKIFLKIGLILLALIMFLFFIDSLKDKRAKEERILKIEETRNLIEKNQILAKAVSIYDLSKKEVIYGKNENEKLPWASLSKIMTVIVALDNKNENDLVKISEKTQGNTKDGSLSLGEIWKIGELAKFTLFTSSNDGALALSMSLENKEDFVKKMNEKVENIGLKNTKFFNSTGLDLDKDSVGALGSAQDANLLAEYAVKRFPDIFYITAYPEFVFKSESGSEHVVKNTNILTAKIPNLILSKTGITELSGGNLTIIIKNNKNTEIAITVLGSTREGRFLDMENLVKAVSDF